MIAIHKLQCRACSDELPAWSLRGPADVLCARCVAAISDNPAKIMDAVTQAIARIRSAEVAR